MINKCNSFPILQCFPVEVPQLISISLQVIIFLRIVCLLFFLWASISAIMNFLFWNSVVNLSFYSILLEINCHMLDWRRWSRSFQDGCKSICSSSTGKDFGHEYKLSWAINFWTLTLSKSSESWFPFRRKYSSLPGWHMAWQGQKEHKFKI